MLRADAEDLLAYGARLGMHMHLNTNGYRVADAARDLLRTGLRSVNVSLDGATAREHDRARGRSGAFDMALDAIRALREARDTRARPRITAVTVLTSANVHHVSDVAEVAREAGADRIGIIPVHDFGQEEERPDPGAVRRGMEALRNLHAEGFLDNSLAYVDLVPRALNGEPSPLRCYAPHASVVVDAYGDVYPCFPMMERDVPVGRIPLARLWRSRRYAAVRRGLRECRACLWNCHAEMNLALPQPSAPRKAVETARIPG
jgi:MoaA/NifB/PqqE/SkfB family radical SAM enzyme